MEASRKNLMYLSLPRLLIIKKELIFDLACSDIYAQAVYEKYGYVMKNELQQNIIRI